MGGKYQELLYSKVKKLKKPFFEWNDWIKEQLDVTLNQYKERKVNRLMKIGKAAGAKLFGKKEKEKPKIDIKFDPNYIKKE